MITKRSLTSLQYISDIHLEYRQTFPRIPIRGANLALLGDIGNPFKNNYTDFLSYASNNWNKVFLITGNHEYWQDKYNIDEVDNEINNIVTKFNNVTFLNNNKAELHNYTILGTTLWSKIQQIPKRIMGDDLYIKFQNRNVNFQDLNIFHNNSVEWLEKNIKETTKPLIVLTHHLPSYKLIVDKYKVGYFEQYQDRFASNLDHLITNPVKFWLCGHSHSTNEMKINGVFCAINAFGYSKLSDIKKEEDIIKLINLTLESDLKLD